MPTIAAPSWTAGSHAPLALLTHFPQVPRHAPSPAPPRPLPAPCCFPGCCFRCLAAAFLALALSGVPPGAVAGLAGPSAPFVSSPRNEALLGPDFAGVLAIERAVNSGAASVCSGGGGAAAAGGSLCAAPRAGLAAELPALARRPPRAAPAMPL